jgi:guanylate kinase
MPQLPPHARAIVVTAPSGAGKTTLVRSLMDDLGSQLAFSVSATTRPRRSHEVHGQHYQFLTEEAFREHIARQEFVEYEEVYPGRLYGTLITEVERIAALGCAVVFDVDVNGALHLKHWFGAQALSVFVLPPSKEHLRMRLVNRATESAAEIEIRMGRADYELSLASKFDLQLVNDFLPHARANLVERVSQFLASGT